MRGLEFGTESKLLSPGTRQEGKEREKECLRVIEMPLLNYTRGHWNGDYRPCYLTCRPREPATSE